MPEEDKAKAEGGQQPQPEEENLTAEVTKAIGEWGKWQTYIFFLFALPSICSTYPILVMTFMNAKVDYWCRQPDDFGGSAELWRNQTAQFEDKSCDMLPLGYQRQEEGNTCTVAYFDNIW